MQQYVTTQKAVQIGHLWFSAVFSIRTYSGQLIGQIRGGCHIVPLSTWVPVAWQNSQTAVAKRGDHDANAWLPKTQIGASTNFDTNWSTVSYGKFHSRYSIAFLSMQKKHMEL